MSFQHLLDPRLDLLATPPLLHVWHLAALARVPVALVGAFRATAAHGAELWHVQGEHVGRCHAAEPLDDLASRAEAHLRSLMDLWAPCLLAGLVEAHHTGTCHPLKTLAVHVRGLSISS